MTFMLFIVLNFALQLNLLLYIRHVPDDLGPLKLLVLCVLKPVHGLLIHGLFSKLCDLWRHLIANKRLDGFLVNPQFTNQVLRQLPLFGELMIVGIEFEFIRLELNFIEEGIEAFEVHCVNVLLFYTFCQDRLVGEGDRSGALGGGELVVINDVEDVVLELFRLEVLGC